MLFSSTVSWTGVLTRKLMLGDGSGREAADQFGEAGLEGYDGLLDWAGAPPSAAG
jgi:hypothetical protein